MTTVFQCEIDKHARSVLDHHWPDVPKWDDVSTLTGAHVLEQTGGVDIVAWGSPCQDLSLAGKRAGLSGERSGLFHEGIRIIKELRELSNGTYPTWSLWENVVGALSSNRGADFGKVLWEMDEAGACFSEWVVLDAQYFGVPQRRRRVFVASCFDSGTSERCGSPLFPVAESLPGHLAKGKSKGQGTSGEATEGAGAGGSGDIVGTIGPTFGTRATTAIVEPFPIQDGREIEKRQNGMGVGEAGDPSYTLDQTGAQSVAYSIREDAKAGIFSATEVESARALQALQPSVQSHHAQTFITQPMLVDGRRVDDVRVYGEPVQTLQERMGTGGNNVPVVAQDPLSFDTQFGSNANVFEDQSPTLKASQQSPSVEYGLVVRRLTPLECERLMGWPDNHTAIGTNGAVSDTNRYKMCGNGVASPVAAWLGKHIMRTRSRSFMDHYLDVLEWERAQDNASTTS